MKHDSNTLLHSLPLLLGFAAACGGGEIATTLDSQDLAGGPFDDGPTMLDRASAELRGAELFGGTVISSELDVERGLSVFEIYVALPSGAVIEVKLEEATGRVVEIESKTGPFTDDLDPGVGFVSLQEAIAAAQAARSGTVVGWELELDDGRIWVWEIELDSGVHVKVDARTGAIIDDDHGMDPWDDHGDDSVHAAAPEEIVRAAQAVVDGQVVESERELEHGMSAWKLALRTAGGAEVDIYLLVDGGGLLRVRDDRGPFDYAVTPGRGWITLDDALDAAGVTRSELVEYRLDREDGTLLYELRFARDGNEEDVEVDAATGSLR